MNHSPAVKANGAAAAIKGRKALIDPAQDFDIQLLPRAVRCPVKSGLPSGLNANRAALSGQGRLIVSVSTG